MDEPSRLDRKIAVDRLFRDRSSTLWQELYDQMNVAAAKLHQEYSHKIEVRMNDHRSLIQATVEEDPDSGYRLRRLEIRLDLKDRRIIANLTKQSRTHAAKKGEPFGLSIEPDIEKGSLYFGYSELSFTAKMVAELLLAERLLSMQL
jgi:hypothetical protein